MRNFSNEIVKRESILITHVTRLARFFRGVDQENAHVVYRGSAKLAQKHSTFSLIRTVLIPKTQAVTEHSTRY
jgi:hypothetical protein